jgi:hypothetical protein
MGPTQDPPRRHTNQERSQRDAKRRRRSPRRRLCLLKGCKRRYRPEHPWSRYCGDDCRRKALQWSRWKGQQRYRATRFGKQHRQAQSQRYRQRSHAKKRSKPATNEPARVIKAKIFPAAPVTGLAATYCLFLRGVPPCSTSVRASAGVPWSVCWSGNGAGRSATVPIRPCPVFAGRFVRPDGSRIGNPSGS